MNVSVVIPTRGDQDLTEIIDSLAQFDEVLIWDNSKREDLGVYGRYAMIEEARNDVILTQDDDCVIENPEAIVEAWAVPAAMRRDHVACNTPPQFRAHYTDSALVGFGAVFHRDRPLMAFGKFFGDPEPDLWLAERWSNLVRRDLPGWEPLDSATFRRECDTVFTTLTPRVLVDVPYRDLPWASDDTRLWKQPDHVAQRKRMLDLARKVRDGS